MIKVFIFYRLVIFYLESSAILAQSLESMYISICIYPYKFTCVYITKYKDSIWLSIIGPIRTLTHEYEGLVCREHGTHDMLPVGQVI